MRRTPTIATLALALGATIVPAAQAAKPPASASAPTIGAKPATIVFGRSTAISGQLPGPGNAGVGITLEANPFPFAAFKDVATVLTNASGGYGFMHAPALNTRYRVSAKTKPPTRSAEVLVNVRKRVTLRVSDATPRRGQRVRFAGSAFPAHDGLAVSLQRRTSRGFRTVATSVLRDAGDTRSSYRRTLRIRASGTFRVVVAKDADHAAGISRRITLRVP